MIRPVRKSKLVAYLNKTKTTKSTARKGISKVDRIERTDWLKTALNLAIEAGQELWEDPQYYFRVSGLGDPCIRSMVLYALGHRTPYEAKKLRIFRVGTLIGQVIADTLEKRGILLEAEGEVVLEDPPIKGHFDVDIQGEEEYEDEEFIGEVKSMNDYSFDRLPEEHDFTLAGDSPLMQGYEGYLIQWNTYAILKGNLRGFIIFESKNTQRHKVFWLAPDSALYERIISKCTSAKGYLNTNTIPPVPSDRKPHGNDAVCGKCPRRYLCELLPTAEHSLERAREIDAQVRG